MWKVHTDWMVIEYDQLVNKSFAGQKTVLVHGIFDLLHFGHVKLLAEAKKHGDVLIVGVEPNSNTKIIKGPNRPIHDEAARCFVLAHLAPVDYVFLIPEYPSAVNQDAFYVELYQTLNPNVVATCVKAGPHGPLKRQHAKDLGIAFIDIDSQYAKNTSAILAQLQA